MAAKRQELKNVYLGLKVAVVIPCYRAERSIAGVIAEIPEFVDLIVAVNDASTDLTSDALAAIDSLRLRVLHHEFNQGVGGAMATGFACALREGADIVVKMDADGQMAPERMIDLVDPIAQGLADYAKGNRFLHARELKQMPLVRKLGSIALTFVTKLASGYWHVFDPQNGYLAIAREYLEQTNVDRLRNRRYFFENEMLIQLNVLGARTVDCAMPARYGDETSGLRISRVLLYFPYFLFRGFLHRMLHRYVLRDFSIIIPLFGLGGMLFVFGFLFGAYHWWLAIQTSRPTPIGTIMLSALPLILGLQLLLQGLVVDIMQSPRGETPKNRARGLDRHVGLGFGLDSRHLVSAPAQPVGGSEFLLGTEGHRR